MVAAANYDQRSSSFSVDLVSNKMGHVTILTSNENPSDFRYFDNLGSKNLFSTYQSGTPDGIGTDALASPNGERLNVHSPTFRPVVALEQAADP